VDTVHPTQNPPAEVAVPTPAETLRDAALYLERRGWYRSEFFDFEADPAFPPACAVGAARVALFGEPLAGLTRVQDQALNAVLVVLADYLTDPRDDDDLAYLYSPTNRIGDWNDAYGRTADEVIATLRAAADDWDRTHGGAR
jgi:hypothetical protein